MKVCVVYGVMEERDTGMIVDYYANLVDVFSNKEEAYKLVNWLEENKEAKRIYGWFDVQEFELEDKFNPDNYKDNKIDFCPACGEYTSYEDYVKDMIKVE